MSGQPIQQRHITHVDVRGQHIYDDARRDTAGIQAAVFFGLVRAQQTKLAHTRNKITVEALFAIALLARLCGGKTRCRILNRALFFTELHRRQPRPTSMTTVLTRRGLRWPNLIGEVVLQGTLTIHIRGSAVQATTKRIGITKRHRDDFKAEFV